jgi:lipopolysaccharide/colanic/teichoic acid biosynthesis glycosyltransferase
MRNKVLSEIGEGQTIYLEKFLSLNDPEVVVVSTTSVFNIENYNGKISSIVNLSKVNDIRFINKFFEAANNRLGNNGVFIVTFESLTARRERLRIGRIPILKNLYFTLEFLFLRVAPKVWGLKKIYFLLTRGRNRLLSKAEVLGRLVSCGFEIVDYNSFRGRSYVVSRKVKAPDFNFEPSYGPLFRMKRVGKNGKIIRVYKLRTMHPYAEYLQDYVIGLHGYASTGKPENDFRLTPWGRVMRRFWLDELPQILNVIKGDMKLVGIRPVSETYFNNSIPEELREMRKRHKPGCIPPYVALNRKASVEEVLEAERDYMIEKEKRPYTTDTRFFFKALFNIVFRGKRSA